jgi:hypothetical protein
VTALAARLNQVIFAPVTPEEMARKAHATVRSKVFIALNTVVAGATRHLHAVNDLSNVLVMWELNGTKINISRYKILGVMAV